MTDSPRMSALRRSDELKKEIDDYLEFKHQDAHQSASVDANLLRKAILMKYLHATDVEWNDPLWQLKHRVCTAERLALVFQPTIEEMETWKACETKFRFAISPYYLSLIDWDNPLDPLRLQAVPLSLELQDQTHSLDPMNEEAMNPAGCITRRYPDRVILNVTNECAMYCRHCQR